MLGKTSAIVLGAIVIIVGILGFISNPLVGATGYFMTNAALNVVYIVLGLVLLAAAFGMLSTTAQWLKTVGIIYLVLAILGFFMNPILGLLAVNLATGWLHIALGIVLLAAGYMAPETSVSPGLRGSRAVI